MTAQDTLHAQLDDEHLDRLEAEHAQADAAQKRRMDEA